MTEDYAPHDFELGPKNPIRNPSLLQSKAMIVMTKFFPFGGWWLGFIGIFGATGGGCACCALPVCAAAGWSVGVLSALFAWCAVSWKKVIKR